MTKKESGARLGQLAADRGLSAYAIARKLGVSHTTAYGWLEGKFRPGREHLPGLARLLEVTMGEISTEGAEFAAERSREVAAALLRVVEACLAGEGIVPATTAETGEAAPFLPEELALVEQLTAADLIAYFDERAGGAFRDLPVDRKLALIQTILNPDPAAPNAEPETTPER